jgi:outer membrane protein assembly factor BamB
VTSQAASGLGPNRKPASLVGTRTLPNGGAYAGPALYTDSLLSLTGPDGRLRWYSQVTPHDVRDYDFTLPPMLTQAGGAQLVIDGGKAGAVIAWDRRTRERVWITPVGLHRHDEGSLPAKPVEVCPGLFGGVLTPMAAANGRVFVAVVNLCMRGSATGYEPLAGVDIESRGRGQFTALNEATGRKLWTRSLPYRTSAARRRPEPPCSRPPTAGASTGSTSAPAPRSGRCRSRPGSNACPAVGDGRLVVAAGASPITIRTPTPVIDAYALG